MTIAERVGHESFEPADDLIHESPDLGQVASDREDLRAQPVGDRSLDALRQPLRSCRGDLREGFELRASSLEHLVEGGCIRALRDPFLRALDSAVVHL